MNETFQAELRDVINRCSIENGSDTPDYILAEYLNNCRIAFNMAIKERQKHKAIEEANLRPCPFCGTKRTKINEWMYGAEVICECGGKGPEGYGESRKIVACDLWNRREEPKIS